MSPKEIWNLSNQILEYSNRGVLRAHFQEEVARMILGFAGCEAVELWLQKHRKFFRYEVAQYPNPPAGCHTSYSVNENDEFMGAAGIPNLVRLGQEVLRGRFQHTLPFMTARGTFWTGNAPKLLASLSKQDPGFSLDGPLNEYSSLALVTIGADSANMGLLILKSREQSHFRRGEIEIYENLSQSLSIALAHRHAQVDLRERVKELTCLYGIARLVAQPAKPMAESLSDIVELLPKAWLYPEVASARILLDGRPYTAPAFAAGISRQQADILVDGTQRGTVEVVYLEKKPEVDEGPFLQEERHLIDTVAREIASILKQKEIENDQLQLQEQLRHADRLATIGQLAAGVAHEINEPLGNIMGFAELTRKCPSLPAQAGRDIEKILAASMNARDIIRKILIFARQMPPQKTLVNLNQLIEEGLHFFKARSAKEGVEIIQSL
ncbi:MAG: hypothetical protein NTY64_23840, partial [Deltaproteobacteria bacterium]|nr:hypothetical protein [Deltaproteobacteria bacterium]